MKQTAETLDAIKNLILNLILNQLHCTLTSRKETSDKDIESPDSSVSFLSDSGQRFFKNLDRTQTAHRIETDRIRTDRHRRENTDIIRTADRHRTGFSGKYGQKQAKD